MDNSASFGHVAGNRDPSCCDSRSQSSVSSRTLATPQITTERVSLSSVAYSSPTHHTTSSWVPFPLSLLLRAPPPPPTTGSASTTSSPAAPLNTDPSHYPLYRLTLSYSHSANANKSLLASSTVVLEKPLGEMFDENGTIAVQVVEDWVMGSQGLGKVVKGGQGAGAIDGVGN